MTDNPPTPPPSQQALPPASGPKAEPPAAWSGALPAAKRPLLGRFAYLVFKALSLPFSLLALMSAAPKERKTVDVAPEQPIADGAAREARVKVLVDIWKQVVAVQQHFNDIEIKIRDFAVTLALAVVGAAGFVAKEHATLHLWGIAISLGLPIAMAGMGGLFALWFMDRLWYHRLLMGAVYQGVEVEEELARLGYSGARLTDKIGRESPFRWFGGPEVHSKDKIDFFYGVLVIGLLVVGIALAIGEVAIAKTKPAGQLSPAATPTLGAPVAAVPSAIPLPMPTATPTPTPIPPTLTTSPTSASSSPPL